jgi:hypothetical protein
MSEGVIQNGMRWLLGSSWRMTLTGLAASLAVVWPQLGPLFDGDPATRVDWSVVAAAFFVAVMGGGGRHNAVSSEQAGVSPRTPLEQLIQRVSESEEGITETLDGHKE